MKDQTPKWTTEVIAGFTTCAGVSERVVIKSPGSEELFSSLPIHGREQPEYACPEMSANARLIQAQADEDLRRALNAAQRIVDLLNADDLAAAKTEAAS